jgi:hypothetical protein
MFCTPRSVVTKMLRGQVLLQCQTVAVLALPRHSAEPILAVKPLGT